LVKQIDLALVDIRREIGALIAGGGTRPVLVSLAGLPGSGKSWLAEAIRQATGADVVRTDEVRRVLYPQPTYAPTESAAVYATCFATVRALLRVGRVVVFDGTNGRREGRGRFATVARMTGAGYASVLVQAPPDVIRERIARRHAGLAPAFGSEAGVAVYERMVLTEDYGGRFALVIDTSGDVSPAIDRLVALIEELRAVDHRHDVPARRRVPRP
jgi:predicted kinase